MIETMKSAHSYCLSVFSLLPFTVNSTVTPFPVLVHYQHLTNTYVGHLHQATCSWDFGALHSSTFEVGENPSLFKQKCACTFVGP